MSVAASGALASSRPGALPAASVSVASAVPARSERKRAAARSASSVNVPVSSSAEMPSATSFCASVGLSEPNQSPLSRRTANVPLRRGVAESDQSPPSSSVDGNGSGVPANCATAAAEMPVNEPCVEMRP